MNEAPDRPWLPYVLPMGVFLGFSMLEGYLPKGSGGGPHPTWYPLAYTAKIAAVLAAMWFGRSTWSDLKPRPGMLGWALAIGAGVLVTGMWVGLDGWYYRFDKEDARAAFDPFTLPPAARFGFLAVRLLGLVVVVPIFEELFWRSFLLRWVIDPDHFRDVPIGRVTPMAAGVSAALFASAHPEWLPALLTGLLWAGLLWRTKSLLACVVSHMVANLGLGLYVLATHQWKYW
ncbi:CAAX prenyl protease-related protein [Tundrisphaera sp. TA3]|uniref:CAAX prenyl protease-related protein n=1 Tax=Tundrisphaera sp. TA3 TaxID=3435775 RepID=UPI003EB86ED7